MVKVWSWHYKGFDKDVLIHRNRTHFRLPVCMEFEADSLVTDPEVVLGEAFDFFNWVGVDFCAPVEVNENARQYNTHASQSVGDVVEIEGKGGGWWMVKGLGWQKLTEAEMVGSL